MEYSLKPFRYILSIGILLILLLFSACGGYHFANPLPIDSKNIYKTPKKLRGSLTDENSIPLGTELEKHVIILSHKEPRQIINGIWFHPKDTMDASKIDTVTFKKIMDMPAYDSRYTVKFDSLKRPIDTVENFVMKNNRIYQVLSNDLGEGLPYIEKNDTLYEAATDHKIVLGPNAFYRKITSDYYMINIKDSDAGIGSIDWWQIRLLEKRKDGKVILYDWDNWIEGDTTRIYFKNDDYYFDSEWTRKDIMKLIKDGAFKPFYFEK